ncbi:hypothetical protein [Cohnella terricola]|uniref:Methyl-accepting transducer domain-containing protein n=1 Tax=Cohnella terricola TaxID=1289167 RepID=A0A559JAK1_9BACL|nr:hypothetical protein [Cohnella terricola]TVX96877.1 hypothetical protein FPZ45_19980 [Cohnella terricola]
MTIEAERLIEETGAAVKQIEDLIQQSNAYADEVILSIGEVKQLVERGQLQSDQTRETFDGILRTLENSMDEIQRVEKELDALVKAIGEVGATTSTVAVSAAKTNIVSPNY